jgi:protein-disulfide isomerase
MTWTILALVVAIALYMFGGMLVGHDPKKQTSPLGFIAKKSIKLLAIILMIVGVARLWTPYYLTSVNPGIIMEMVKGAKAAEQGKSSDGVKKYVRKHAGEMMKNAPVIGNSEAKKTIFLFTDYSCPYCRRVHGELVKVLEADKDVKVVIKNFSIHGVLSDAPAKAMIAAKMQGCDTTKLNAALMEKNYWPVDLQKAGESEIEKTILKNVLEMAKKAGCDADKLKSDLESEVVASELAQVRELAQEFGVQGTPFLIVGDQAFPGAIPASQIQSALK